VPKQINSELEHYRDTLSLCVDNDKALKNPVSTGGFQQNKRFVKGTLWNECW